MLAFESPSSTSKPRSYNGCVFTTPAPQLQADITNATVVLASPDSMRSENVRREIEYALGDPKYEGRLFPVEVRRTTNIPWILRKLKTFEANESPAKVGEAITNALKRVA